jgi:hypothetical protein
MIITRTGEAVEFHLTETRRVAIDASRVASTSHVVERAADGKVVNALVLIMGRGEASVRVQASAAQVAAMHASLAEIMSETTGPALTSGDRPSNEREQFIH